ncbi:MAG: phosphatase PAP2 family protein [Cephaloticoccus sp.]|nr:phosphatase PAP2 family protein [Cephaloticoccus sp.]
MFRLPRDRLLWVALASLAGVILWFEFTDLDLRVQDRLYDFAHQRWVVDGNEPVGRLLFYNGPKIAVWFVGLTVLTLTFGPARWRDRWRFNRRGLGVAALTLATLPVLAGVGKNFTNVFCPSEVQRYGGSEPYVKLCSPYPDDQPPAGKGHCFPAGHASGGFALMGLAWLRASRRWRRGAILLGLAVGWWMGGYQMLKGAHYLSHTLVTMTLAWVVMLGWLRVLRPPTADS